MGCGEACPVLPGNQSPAGNSRTPPARKRTTYAPIWDEIRARIETLIADIDAKPEA
ncbi:hypothetical protein [Streptomyces sp. NPDC058045]|uniref:hypothetical protein n=1 Tax=Streptomyces sp. NPDC058045 TaxID=3346311 RepID=UPI0036E4A306